MTKATAIRPRRDSPKFPIFSGGNQKFAVRPEIGRSASRSPPKSRPRPANVEPFISGKRRVEKRGVEMRPSTGFYPAIPTSPRASGETRKVRYFRVFTIFSGKQARNLRIGRPRVLGPDWPTWNYRTRRKTGDSFVSKNAAPKSSTPPPAPNCWRQNPGSP